VAVVQSLEHGGENRAVFSSRSTNSDFLARLKEVGGGDSLGDFIFKDGNEAWSADAGVVFGSEDLRAIGVANLALAWRHGDFTGASNMVLSYRHEVVKESKVGGEDDQITARAKK
jgi:hypothetical protein